MKKEKPLNQMMSREWIRQAKQIRDRQSKEYNFLISQTKQGLKNIVWNGQNTKDVVEFCLDWLNCYNQNIYRNWMWMDFATCESGELGSEDRRLNLVFGWQSSRYSEMREYFEHVSLFEGCKVYQSVNLYHDSGLMRCIQTSSPHRDTDFGPEVDVSEIF